MAKYCSLWCWMRECSALWCNLAGGGMHGGTGCSHGAAEGLQLACRWEPRSWLPSAVPAGVMYRRRSSLFADTGFLSSMWSWMIHQWYCSPGSFPGCYLLSLFFFFSFIFFPASALSLRPLCAHGVNDNPSCSWGARCGSGWVSSRLVAEGDSGVMSLFTDPPELQQQPRTQVPV